MFFNENGITVDREFVRFGTRAIRISEIKVVDQASRRVDGHWAPILWVATAILFIVAIATPVLFLVVLGFGAAAWHKQRNPKPVYHMLRVSAGGLTNTQIYEATDSQKVTRLRLAIERAVRMKASGSQSASATVPRVDRADLADRPSENVGPWG